MMYCTYCCKNHDQSEMVTSNGQKRLKCIIFAKMRNATDEHYQLYPKDGAEFATERDAENYLEDTDFVQGFQLYVDSKYTSEENKYHNVLSSKYYYCACHEHPPGTNSLVQSLTHPSLT